MMSAIFELLDHLPSAFHATYKCFLSAQPQCGCHLWTRPKLIGGNTEAACVMIGEKAASMIIEDSVANPGSQNCLDGGKFSIERATTNLANSIRQAFRRISQMGRRNRLRGHKKRQKSKTSQPLFPVF